MISTRTTILLFSSKQNKNDVSFSTSHSYYRSAIQVYSNHNFCLDYKNKKLESARDFGRYYSITYFLNNQYQEGNTHHW